MSDRSFLQWPFFEDEHRALALKLEDWAKAELIDYSATPANVDLACKELVLKLADAGWLDYCVSKKFEGGNPKLNVRSLCIIRETLASFSGLADFVFAMQGLGSGTISFFGSAKMQEKYLPDVRKGGEIAAFALTEPDAGSDAAAITTTAKKDHDSFLLNGEKTLISNGGIADYYTVFAKTGEAPGTRGISAFIVDADTVGLEILERIEVIAPHPLARIRFNQCRIP